MNPHFLLRCIELAKTRLGFCAPNPAVGCVVVKDDKIIAEGFHLGCGHAHAEVDALNKINDEAYGATLYVSLEPCCHYGRTPPCTERIIKAGIKKVYFGLKDPNPLVAGKGQATLIDAGIACEQIELPEIRVFYAPYVYWTQTQLPFVTIKLAMSADHKIAYANGKTAQITGKECGRLTHVLRRQSDAILTSITTVINDDPQLNVRQDDGVISKPIYILDSHGRLPLDATIVQTAKSITVFHARDADARKIATLEYLSVRCIAVERNNGGLDLASVLKHIGRDGVHQLWVEAGDRVFNSFFTHDLLQKIIIYLSPTLLGDKALSTTVTVERLQEKFELVRESRAGEDRVFYLDQKSR